MKPIPKKLLIHSATLKNVTFDDWQNETFTTAAELTSIRIEPSSKLVTDKQNRQITLAAIMFYDCRNSSPEAVEFHHGQRVEFNGTLYRIELIEALYDGEKLHHYELGLI